MSVAQTKATLTVYYVRETHWFWKRFRTMKSVAILCHLASPVPNLARNRASVMEWNPWKGWQVTKELHQWRGENIGETAITRPVHHTDEEYMNIWETTLGNTHFRDIELTPERTIGRMLGMEPWTKTTWKALNFK
jgi:hypothetical protein